MNEKMVTGLQSHEILIEEIPPPPLIRDVSNYENLVQQLSAMGFDPRKIEIAITNTGANNIEDL